MLRPSVEGTFNLSACAWGLGRGLRRWLEGALLVVKEEGVLLVVKDAARRFHRQIFPSTAWIDTYSVQIFVSNTAAMLLSTNRTS